MNILQANYAKIVAADGDLDSAAQLDLYGDDKNISFKVEGIEVEKILSSHPNPTAIYEVGTNLEISFVLAEIDLDKIVQILGGTHTSGVYTKSQGTRTLSQYDLRFGVKRTDNAIVKIDFTYMHLKPLWEDEIKNQGLTLLPVSAKGSNLSVFKVDNSAA
jgi:hypothetical protein